MAILCDKQKEFKCAICILYCGIMDVEETIAEAKKREEENKINKKIISNAIIELFTNFKYKHGSIKKN